MGRMPCCEKDNVKRGQWTPEEDAKLVAYISQHGTRNWRLIPRNAGLQRCGKSCRLRWTNYLRPDLRHGEFTDLEEQTIVKLHSVVGNRWSLIAAQLPGRTDNDVKNHWNTKLKKKLSGMGIDPVTHKPFSHLMAEIASTLAPPQVANLAEAALGCFKDEMLHLLTKKRIDSWQLENISLHGHRPWDLPPPPYNNFLHNNNTNNNNYQAGHANTVEEKKAMMMRSSGRAHNNNYSKDNDNVLEKMKQGLANAVLNPQPDHPDENNIPSRGPNCWETGIGVQICGGEINLGMLNNNVVTSSSGGHHAFGASSSSKCAGGGGEEGESSFTVPSAPPAKHEYHRPRPHPHPHEVVQGGSNIMMTWKQMEHFNGDTTMIDNHRRNESGRSAWSQSACSGSTCTGSDNRDEEDKEEEEEGASDAENENENGNVKSVHGVFNPDCVLWDLSDDLITPII